MVVAICLLLACACADDAELCRPYRRHVTLEHSVHPGVGGVTGVAQLADRLYVTTHCDVIRVFNATDMSELEPIRAKELSGPWDMAACPRFGRLYVTDFYTRPESGFSACVNYVGPTTARKRFQTCSAWTVPLGKVGKVHLEPLEDDEPHHQIHERPAQGEADQGPLGAEAEQDR